MQPPYFVLNLKADLTLEDCVDFINALTDEGKKKFRSLFVALPFTRLEEMAAQFSQAGIFFGAARLNSADNGSFTGPIASKMIKRAGGAFALIGSKEERELLSPSKDQLLNKLKSAKEAQLKIFYCIPWVEEELKNQLEVLKEIDIFSCNELPFIILELPFGSFKSYLPSQEELNRFWTRTQGILQEEFGDEGKKIQLIVSLPADILGFSSLINQMPFSGAFFTKSGIYPHAVHRETLELFHLHSENGLS